MNETITIKRDRSILRDVPDYVLVKFRNLTIRVQIPHGHSFGDAPIEYSIGEGWMDVGADVDEEEIDV